MNAFPRDLALDVVPSGMARDLLGIDGVAPSAIKYHTAMSSLAIGGTLGLADTTWPMGTRIEPHAHAGEDEIIIVLSGTIELRYLGRTLRFKTGETAFVPRGTVHEVRAVTETRHIAILTRKSLEGPRPV